MPPSTIAPEVGVLGVNPVVPPLNVPDAPGAPAGIPKLNVAAELLPTFVTVGVDPYGSVVAVPAAMVAAAPTTLPQSTVAPVVLVSIKWPEPLIVADT